MGRKLALLIGNSRYDDPGLARLQAADVDVREIADVLRHPEIGEFDEVTELPNQGLAAVRRSIAQFFRQGKKDDLLVFYFSGHGVKDENGHLYLAVRDTELPLLSGTAIESAFITAQMDRSFSRRQVLILDCCHSGAFAAGAKGGAQSVGIGPAFEGNGFGHVVLTATDSTQYAWEGDRIIGDSDKSVFTHYLLQGLRTGDADTDGDGQITIDELYDYVFEHVVRETPKQTPGKWSYKVRGAIVIAQNPQSARPAPLSLELQALVDSPLARLRAEAIPDLAELLHGPHRGLALAARRALEQLRGDDSRKVSAAAEEILATLPAASATESDTAGVSAPDVSAPEVHAPEQCAQASAIVVLPAGAAIDEVPAVDALVVSPARMAMKTPWWRSRPTYTAFAAVVVAAVLLPYFAANRDVPVTQIAPAPRPDVVLHPDVRAVADAAPPATPPVTESVPVSQPRPAQPRPAVMLTGSKASPAPAPAGPPAPVAAQQPVIEVQIPPTPPPVGPMLKKASGLFETGQYAEALRLIDEVLKSDAKNPDALALRQKALAAQAFEGRLGK
jgi:hypothetical protein